MDSAVQIWRQETFWELMMESYLTLVHIQKKLHVWEIEHSRLIWGVNASVVGSFMWSAIGWQRNSFTLKVEFTCNQKNQGLRSPTVTIANIAQELDWTMLSVIMMYFAQIEAPFPTVLSNYSVAGLRFFSTGDNKWVRAFTLYSVNSDAQQTGDMHLVDIGGWFSTCIVIQGENNFPLYHHTFIWCQALPIWKLRKRLPVGSSSV